MDNEYQYINKGIWWIIFLKKQKFVEFVGPNENYIVVL
jgi:hypothetical protein